VFVEPAVDPVAPECIDEEPEFIDEEPEFVEELGDVAMVPPPLPAVAPGVLVV